MRWVFILNPGSGRKKTRERFLPAIERFMRESGREWEVKESAGMPQIREHALEAARAGADVLVAVGGDGTVREAACGLEGSRTALAILPAGSGNAVARELGIPLEPGAAVEALARSRPRVFDVGRANGRTFLMALGIGVDARVARLYAERGSAGRGAVPYLRLAAREALRARPQSAVIRAGGEVREVSAFMIVAANISRYGYNARVAPAARFDDGLLDVVIVGALPLLSLPAYGLRLFTGTFDRAARVSTMRVPSLRIDGAPFFDAHLDGDPVRFEGAVDISVLPGALRVLAPY